MSALERFRQLIDEHQRRLRSEVLSDREAAIVALVRTLDRLPLSLDHEPMPDLITGRRLANPGGNKALRLCLESTERGSMPAPSSGEALERWAERFLGNCGELALAELVLTHCESGFMRLVDGGNGGFDAWIATKRAPTGWRERADIDWWAESLANSHEPDRLALQAKLTSHQGDDGFYRRLAGVYLNMMAYQLGYPADAAIGGCAIQTYRDVLGVLLGWALKARDQGEESKPRSRQSLVASLASILATDPGVIGHAVEAFTLGGENAAYHGAVPGVAAAPLVRAGANQVIASLHGLTTEPLLFLTRELRRRAGQEYHNSGHLRETVFRQDLYGLFEDKRFVTSTGRIVLRRDDRDVRTDIDAVVFDRKSGALGLFELKSQDPFARSTAELTRQRDTVLYANRQVSGVLDWIKRHGADEILNRVDSRTAKTFRARKVFPFVLGRYLVHFNDGPAPDRRAAWGTWPQVLRLLAGQPVRATDASPIASLFNRLTNDEFILHPPAGSAPRAIAIGGARLTVHSSFAAFQTPASSKHGK